MLQQPPTTTTSHSLPFSSKSPLPSPKTKNQPHLQHYSIRIRNYPVGYRWGILVPLTFSLEFRVSFRNTPIPCLQVPLPKQLQ